jgi:hypothetical protein
MRNRSALVVAGLLHLVGCTDMTAPGNSSLGSPFEAANPTMSAADVAQVEASLKHLAEAVAGAMQDAEVRLSVRDAMRDSPWNSHKLRLQEFLVTEQGQALADAAAIAAGESAEQFSDRAAGLPLLDFYVPSREGRKTWRATPGVAIDASLNFEDGNVYRFGPGDTGAPGVRMLLHPAESRAMRLNPQPAGLGEVIQSESDGEEAYTLRWVGADGTVIVKDLHSTASTHPVSSGILMSTLASSNSDSTRLGCININGWEDSGDNEVILKIRFYEPDGTYRGYAEWADHNFPSNTTKCPGISVIGEVIPDGEHNGGKARINIDVWEDDCDCFGNNDDHIGSRDFFDYDNDQTRDVPTDPLIKDWRAAIDLEWIARAPSSFTSVSVPDVWVYVGDGTYASARALDQYGYGLPGYSASSWWTGNTSIATVDSYGYVTGVSVGSTTLSATISGLTGSGTVTVEESLSCDPNSTEIC